MKRTNAKRNVLVFKTKCIWHLRYYKMTEVVFLLFSAIQLTVHSNDDSLAPVIKLLGRDGTTAHLLDLHAAMHILNVTF